MSLSLNHLATNTPQIPICASILLETPSLHTPAYWPFANTTLHCVMQWLNNGNTAKSEAQMNEFVHNVILTLDFTQKHLASFDAHHENQCLDDALSKSSLQSQFTTSVISEAFNSPLLHLFHFSPFKLYHHSPITNSEEQVFGEVYTLDAFLKEHEKVQCHSKLPPDDLECKREKVVTAVMFLSNATHLTSFGNAKAWPIYLMLGNLSKYV